MIYSYCLDEEKRIISICADDLSGCSDWHRGDIDLTPADDLTDDHGAALYKIDNGEIVKRTLEDRMADWPLEQQDDEATLEDYLIAIGRLGVTT